MANIFLYICFLIFKSTLYAYVIERGKQDKFNAKKCWKLKGFWDGSSCKCYDYVSTFASKTSVHFGGGLTCTSARELKCNILSDIELISTIKNFPMIGYKCDISRIMIWNVPTESVNENGVWMDVTNISSKYIYLNKTRNSYEIVSNLPMTSWAGQLIKIIFDCDDACALLKVQGRISYPFDRTKLIPTSTTSKPSTTVTTKLSKTGKGTPYIVIGTILAVAFIIFIISYVFRRKLPCCTRCSQEKEKSVDPPIYSEPIHLLTSSDNADGTTEKTDVEVYYSTIDPLPISHQGILSDDASSVNNPAYTAATSNIIKLQDYEELPGSDPHPYTAPSSKLQDYEELPGSDSHYAVPVYNTGTNNIEESETLYENMS